MKHISGCYKKDRVKRIWCLLPMRAAKVQASLRIRAVSPEPSLLAHTSSQSRGTFRQKTRSLAPLNDWACAVEICHDGMLEDTNSLDGAQMKHISACYKNVTYFTFYEACTVCQNFLFSCGKKILDFCLTVLIFSNTHRARHFINDPSIRVQRYLFIFTLQNTRFFLCVHLRQASL